MNARALLALLRPPNVFTAFADSLAGLLVLWGLGVPVPDRACAILLASGCLYLSGIVLNDVLDRNLDAIERPTRPIPSGAVPLRIAVLLGVGLMVAGLGIAWWVGRAPFTLAVVLAGAILAYDAGAKHTPLGPLVMGSCRGLDVAMGVACGLSIEGGWPPVAFYGPVVLALYVAALTYIARDEVDGNTARRARTGLTAMASLAAVVVVGLLTSGIDVPFLAWGWLGLALGLGWANWSPVWTRHDGPSTGRAIGGGIVLIPVIDATIAAVAGVPLWATAVALLAVPALILKQFFAPT